MNPVVFVCNHGAARSRMASAYFNHIAPPGWKSTSAGLEPQEAMSEVTVRLMAGSEAEPLLDRSPPRPVADSGQELIIAIDCDVPGGARWDLTHHEQDTDMRDEIRERVQRLVANLA